jgi:hypothetical protein
VIVGISRRCARNIGGWTVRNLADNVHRIPEDVRLDPGRIVRIHTGSGANDGNDLFWDSG